MYERPQLKRYGSLRELTEAGFNGTNDGFFLRIASDGDEWSPLACDLGFTEQCTS